MIIFHKPDFFWNSLADFEKKDLVNTFIYHLQFVKSTSIRQPNVEMWANVDKEMASTIADNIGVERPTASNVPVSKSSPALSMANTPHYAYTQIVGVLIGNGFKGEEVRNMLNLLHDYGVFIDIISERLGTIIGDDGTQLEVNKTFKTTHSVLYDSLYIVGGSVENQAEFNQKIMEFYEIAYKHYKPIGIATSGQCYIKLSQHNNFDGVVFATNNPNFEKEFISVIIQQCFWNRI